MIFRYKTHDEQRAERRSYFTEREVPVKGADVTDHPVAPPRTKHRRQTLQEFRKLNTNDKKKSFAKNGQSNVNELFQSEHRTDDGKDLLPVRKTIAFDCHYGFLFEENHEAVSKVNGAQDILVLIKGNKFKLIFRSGILYFSRIHVHYKTSNHDNDFFLQDLKVKSVQRISN